MGGIAELFDGIAVHDAVGEKRLVEEHVFYAHRLCDCVEDNVGADVRNVVEENCVGLFVLDEVVEILEVDVEIIDVVVEFFGAQINLLGAVATCEILRKVFVRLLVDALVVGLVGVEGNPAIIQR